MPDTDCDEDCVLRGDAEKETDTVPHELTIDDAVKVTDTVPHALANDDSDGITDSDGLTVLLLRLVADTTEVAEANGENEYVVEVVGDVKGVPDPDCDTD